jgi:uncharacterized protein
MSIPVSIRIIDSCSARQLPWKNGKGVTLELAIAPPDAGLDDFDWRISSARVDSAGPFSHYPGIDRSLGLLSGAGLRLNLGEQPGLDLDRHNPVLSFAGELDVQAELLAGPVQDFNLMSRRGRWRHRLEYQQLQGERWLDCSEVLFIYCIAGSPLDCQLPCGSLVQLANGQGLLLESPGEHCKLSNSDGSVQLFLAWLERARG